MSGVSASETTGGGSGSASGALAGPAGMAATRLMGLGDGGGFVAFSRFGGGGGGGGGGMGAGGGLVDGGITDDGVVDAGLD